MPIYEYQCLECGKRTETLQSMHDAPLTTCAECNGPLRKLISSPAFQFKGSGWYVTDYARGSGGKDGGKDKDGGGKESGGEQGGSDSKSSDSAEKADKKDKKEGGESSGGAKETPAPSAPKSSSPTGKD